ncbi:MAG: N-acetylmuramoyl-L-alanine amidase [candidate division WOR-3 bacterium]
MLGLLLAIRRSLLAVGCSLCAVRRSLSFPLHSAFRPVPLALRVRRAALVPLLYLLLAAAAWAQSKSGVPVVLFAGAELPCLRLGNKELVSLADVVRALNGKWWSVDRRFIAVLPGPDKETREWVFQADSLSAHIAGSRVHLPEPCIELGGRLFVPLSALPLLSGSDSLVVASVQAWCRAETVIVEVVTTGDRTKRQAAVHGEQVSSLEYRVTLAARPDSGLVQRLVQVPAQANGLIRRVAVDTSSSTVLTFIFDRSVNVRTFELTRPADQPGFKFAAWPRPGRKITRVILDPGHGGTDPGAVSSRGTLEKTVVLDIAGRLKKKLERAGFEVVTTRDGDAFVSLAQRSRLGNGVNKGQETKDTSRREAAGSVFVSVHANASPNRSACGFETYFLSEARTDWERAVAARENAAFDLTMAGDTGPGDDVGLILADLAQNEFLWESSELAARIQEATVVHARVLDRGVRQAGFYVLRNTFMPAVLVECGFLSNRSEDKLLRTEAHRERLAEGIARGIIAFARRYEEKSER